MVVDVVTFPNGSTFLWSNVTNHSNFLAVGKETGIGHVEMIRAYCDNWVSSYWKVALIIIIMEVVGELCRRLEHRFKNPLVVLLLHHIGDSAPRVQAALVLTWCVFLLFVQFWPVSWPG